MTVNEENKTIHDKLQECLNRGVKDYEEIERLRGALVKCQLYFAENDRTIYEHNLYFTINKALNL